MVIRDDKLFLPSHEQERFVCVLIAIDIRNEHKNLPEVRKTYIVVQLGAIELTLELPI